YAAYAGCSAESEASFETVAFLAAKVDELDLPAIMQIETSDGRLARTVRDATEDKDQKILTLDSMQSSVKDDVDGGKSYLETMKKNLEVLKEALN
ncbi:MAG: zinc ABC transporter substrate-binding protein, partial [Clostridia bacterium]|nr:zinc ABC transporter substrate-binding protein [Clostridia bacterium]